jgi:hypothetical protein
MAATMPRHRVPEIVIGFLLATGFWACVQLFAQQAAGPQQHSAAVATRTSSAKSIWEKTTEDPVALYTLVLSLFSGLLVVVTVGLIWVGWRQARLTREIADRQVRDTEILQRAYISADLGGINPFRSTGGASGGGHRVVGHVNFRNVGHLPSRNVSCFMDCKVSKNDAERDFPIPSAEQFWGNYVIPPGSVMKQGTNYVIVEDGNAGYVYVWGEILYDDGFGKRRRTTFCHRYNCIMLHKMDAHGYGINIEDGRYHEYGNSTDES